jgi:bifunctional polynucleotide phosphatase/kinase
MKWIGYHNKDQVILNDKQPIASFDLDWTLIKPTKGIHSKTSDDWIFYSDNVISKLKQYYNEGYTIIIYSNQSRIGKGKLDSNIWINKIEKISKLINIPFIILASIKKDNTRKPKTKLWNQYIHCDKSTSFFIGDAGGLPKRTINGITIKKDFADTDYKFALNIGIQFIHRVVTRIYLFEAISYK